MYGCLSMLDAAGGLALKTVVSVFDVKILKVQIATPPVVTKGSLDLGQRQVDDHSHTSMANPKLLEMLVLEGGIVTIDQVPSGWGCQEQITQTIRNRRTDYVELRCLGKSSLL